ncbi:MAG: 3-deoxy-D-manno-octulosonic acid transferase, partial [Halothiobacillaceae bacterium]
PLAFARLWLKGRDNPAYRERWGERLGHGPDLPKRPRLWVHAVSVGEVIAAAPLIRAWQARHPDWAVLVTTTTPTGSAQVRRLFGDAIEHVYLPYDLPGAVRRFFAHARPTLGVIMETELWPNLFAEADRQGIPLVLANARLSERSMRGYAKVGGLVKSTLGHLRLIAARGPEDAARFIALGADTDGVEALGNLKFDLDVSPEVIERGKAWRAAFGAALNTSETVMANEEHPSGMPAETAVHGSPRPATAFGENRPVWIAASTHPGEDEQVLAAHRIVLATHPDAMLLLAPRHPERADEVAKLAEARGLSLARRSKRPPPSRERAGERGGDAGKRDASPMASSPPSQPSPIKGEGAKTDVMLIDTLGELMDFYAASDIAFVGGSLVAHGGHNPLEPAVLGLPVLTGPHVHNFREVYAAMLPTGAAREVRDADALGEALVELLGDVPLRQSMGAAGKAWVETHRGALERLIERMESAL